MATIDVDGINAQSAPSPIQLAAWTHDWSPQLVALSPWAPHPAGSRTNFRCTTTSSVAQTQAVVDVDLTAWVEDDPGHRGYEVADDDVELHVQISTGFGER